MFVAIEVNKFLLAIVIHPANSFANQLNKDSQLKPLQIKK